MSENNGLLNKNDKVLSIMLVDDSDLIRRFYKMAIASSDSMDASLEAENGQKAIDLARVSKPDVIILDIEMPVMDGITALPKILEASPDSKVIISSTLTNKNAEISIKAMSLGAADYIEKPGSDSDKNEFKNQLIEKIIAISSSPKQEDIYASTHQEPQQINNSEESQAQLLAKPQAIAIASSTGGPQALDNIFSIIKGKITTTPIFITQHMPPTFTPFLASNISRVSGAECIEAKDGMAVENGKIYLAPGDYHMTVQKENGSVLIRLNQNPPENFCRPAADPMLRSIAQTYGSKVLTVILTGMGQDGLEGCRKIAEKGGKIIIQDQESSVVWGMPGAVAKAGLQEGMFPLGRIGYKILEICKVV